MKLRLVLGLTLRWYGLNALFFLGAFVVVALFSILWPQPMLTILGKWATLSSAFGARTAAELQSQPEMFAHVLQRNGIAALVYLVLGFLLQAPLAMLLAGGFYAFIAFLAPYTIGRPFGADDWLLITLENVTLLLAASLTSALAGQLYKVAPTLADWWRHSKKAWRTV